MSIPTSLIVVLLVVAWLVVLVPMVARRREKVPQAEPAGSNFRVLRRASASLRRRPGRGAKGRTVTEMDRQGDTAPETSTEVLVTVGAEQRDEPMDAADEWAAAQAAHAGRVAPQQSPRDTAPTDGFADTVDDRDDDQVALWSDEIDGLAAVDEGSSVDELGRRMDDAEGDVVQPSQFRGDGPGVAAHDDARPSAPVIADEVDEDEWAAHAAAAPAGTYAEVDDEQLRPVPHRPGRGGFDPEAAEATRAYRYQQRRRITLILLIATIAFSVTAFLFVSWLWIGAAVSLALLVGYLSYLRRQVRIEAAIRQRRMERLQRARQIRPEYARPQRRTSRAGMSAVAPGRTVVDLDDDDPGFDDLEEYRQPVTYRRAAGQ